MDGKPSFTLVYGRGQRAEGLTVLDSPSWYIRSLVPILPRHCFLRVTDIAIQDERFSDADVEKLLKFPQLKALDVSRTSISDEGLKDIASLKQLVILNISETNVSTESLPYLESLKFLKELNVSETGIDKESVKHLEQSLPDCWVRR